MSYLLFGCDRMNKKPREAPHTRKSDGSRTRRNAFGARISGRKQAGFPKQESRTALCVTVLFALLLGRASLVGVARPFGTAFYAALLATGSASGVIPGAALVLGALSTRDLVHAWFTLLMIILLRACIGASRSNQTSAAREALIAGGVRLAAGLLWARLTSQPQYSYLSAALDATLVVGLTTAYASGLRLVLEKKSRYGQEQLAAVCILLASLVAGVSDLRIGPLELRNIVGCFVTLLAAHTGGAELGAAAGASVGFVIALSWPLVPLQVGIQAIGGLVGGLFCRAGKLATAVGFAVGALCLSLPIQSSEALTKMILEIGSASALFLLYRVPLRVTRVLVAQPEPVESAAFKENVVTRLGELARVLRELAKSYQNVAVAQNGDRYLAQQIDRIVRRVCASCVLEQCCLGANHTERHAVLTDLLVEADLTPALSQGQMPAEMRDGCPRAQEIIAGIEYLADLSKSNRVYSARLNDMKNVLAAQIKAISSAIDDTARAVLLLPESKQRDRALDYEISIARRAKEGSIMCGDSALYKQLKDLRLALILSDGMGTGPSAALESKATVALLGQLVDNGFEPEIAVDTVNSFMRLKFPDETFATVDMAIIDLTSGDAEFLKRSAAPSFIKRDGQVSVMRASSLPIGILGQSDADRSRRIIKEGDTLVMVTDGAMQWVKSAKKEEPFANYLARQKTSHAGELASRLLDRVLEADQHSLKDDVTIMVIRFMPVSADAASPT